MLRDLFQSNEDPAQTLALQEKVFQDLMERAKELDIEQATLLEEIEMTPEEVDDIVENRKIFTSQQWEEILAQFEEQHPEWSASRSASEIQKTRQGLSEIKLGWLFVR